MRQKTNLERAKPIQEILIKKRAKGEARFFSVLKMLKGEEGQRDINSALFCPGEYGTDEVRDADGAHHR